MIPRSISWLGGPVARAVFVLTGAVTLVLRGQRGQAGLLVVTVAGAASVNSIVKKLVARDRPDAASAGGESFPSGHTTGTLVFTGIAAYLTWRSTGHRFLATAIAVAGIPLTGLIGVSRVVLHEHHPGDVVGGYLVGAAWLMMISKLAPRFLDLDRDAD